MGMFDGKVVIVTGGDKATLKDGSAGSIGYGIDIAFAKEGVNLVIDRAIAEFGRIDAVVNNAQASASGVTIADHTMDQFDLAIYSGLYATFLYMQKAYPHLKETKGSVANFAFGA